MFFQSSWGNNFDAVVQLAERIDEALLEYQHQVANNEGMNRSLEEVMGLSGIFRNWVGRNWILIGFNGMFMDLWLFEISLDGF